MRNLLLILPLLVLLASSSAKACGHYGCDSGWSGMYNTGDFNLYSFGSDMYSLGGYGGGYSDYGYGGGCGSFSGGCGGGYDYAGLYGNDFGMGGGFGGGFSLDIDISISFPSTDFSSFDCFDSFNPYMSGNDLGCGVGYCGSGYMPYSGGDYSYGNPYYDPYQQYYQFPDFLGGYNYNPMQNYPTYPPYYGSIPRDPFAPITPPPTTPTYFGCDNIIVMCPSGPTTRPIPPIWGNIPRNNPPTNYPPTMYPPVNYPPVYPPNNYPPTHGGPIYPPTTNYPPVNPPPGGNPPVNPPVINQPPVNNPPGGNPPFVGNPPPASNSNSGSRPPVVNTVPRV